MEIKIFKYCREIRRGVASTLISGAMISSTIPMQSCSSQQTVAAMQSVIYRDPRTDSQQEVDGNRTVSLGDNHNTEVNSIEEIKENEVPYRGNNPTTNSRYSNCAKVVLGIIIAGLGVSTGVLGGLYAEQINTNRSLQSEYSDYYSNTQRTLAMLARETLLDSQSGYNTSVLTAPVITRFLQNQGYNNSRVLQPTSILEIINGLSDGQIISLTNVIKDQLLLYTSNINRGTIVTDYKLLISKAKTYLSNNCANLVTSSQNNCGNGMFYGVGASGTSGCLLCPDINAKSCRIADNGTVIQSISCKDGYYLNDYSICTKCVTSNCASCNSDGTCNYCILGFYNNNGVCNPCNQAMPGCHYCSSATKCIMCFDQGQYISTNGSSCVSCSSIIPGCSICKSDTTLGYTTCTSCSKNNALGTLFVHPTGLQCNSCSQIIANCLTCKEEGGKSLCTACTNSNYNYLSGDQKKCDICQNIIPGCTTCVGSATSITTCNACDSSKSLFLSSDSKSCGLCSDRFQYCTSCNLNGNQPICISCMSTLYPNTLNSACLPCGLVIPQCTSCSVANSGITQCSSCGLDPILGSQLFVSNGNLSCVSCSNLISNCQTCSQNNTCTICNTGFNLNVMGTCDDKRSVVPAQGGSFSNGGSFAQCQLFASVSMGTSGDTFGLGIVCSSCAQGSRLSGGACIPCPSSSNCNTCDNSGNCLSCSSGYFLGNNVCTSCPTNCNICTNATTCVTCQKGLLLSGTNGRGCSTYPFTTSSGITLTTKQITTSSSTVIIDCGSFDSNNYYPTQGNSNCDLCNNIISNCNSCSVSSVNYVTVCSSCDSEYMLASNSLSCVRANTRVASS